MVNNPFLERFLQRPHWFQETQFVNYDDSLQMQAKLGSFSLEVKWVGAYAYTLGCIEEMNRGHSIMGWLRPMWVGLACLASVPPSPQKTRWGAPDGCFLLSTRQWRTSVLPSPGGKQPVTVGLLWIQQTAFVSPNSETLQKATEWAGDCFLGREPQVWAQRWEEATLSMHSDLRLCMLFLRHTH